MRIMSNVIRSRLCLRPLDPVVSRSSLSFLQEWRKCLSTETQKPPSSALPPSPEGSPVDKFFRSSGTGSVYGKLLGFSKHTMKTDILSLLEGCNVTPNDLKFSYTRGAFNPAAIFVQFSSASSYDNALRSIIKKGNQYRLERAAHSQWDPLAPYEGKVVVIHGLPLNARVEDLDRFLSGCLYYPGSIQFIMSNGPTGPSRVALVRFTSQTQAMHAYITKNKGFFLNHQISMQVLQ